MFFFFSSKSTHLASFCVMISLLSSPISPSNLKPEVGETDKGDSGDIGGSGDVGNDAVFRGCAESVDELLQPAIGSVEL